MGEEFPLWESKSVDVFSIVAKASLALSATSREWSILYFTLVTLKVFL